MNIQEICKSIGCDNYIEWSFGYGPCVSCKLQGQSETINSVAEDCPYKDKFKEVTNK